MGENKGIDIFDLLKWAAAGTVACFFLTCCTTGGLQSLFFVLTWVFLAVTVLVVGLFVVQLVLCPIDAIKDAKKEREAAIRERAEAVVSEKRAEADRAVREAAEAKKREEREFLADVTRMLREQQEEADAQYALEEERLEREREERQAALERARHDLQMEELSAKRERMRREQQKWDREDAERQRAARVERENAAVRNRPAGDF